MRNKLNIPPEGELDFLSLGALVHRLDPGVVPFRKALEYRVHVSGGEYNVAANLSDCFRMRTGIATAMVDYPIGHLIDERVRAAGVRPFYKKFDHDGVNGPNMATVYSDRGYGVRAPLVFYNRANEGAAILKPGDFDWDSIFSCGVRWFHSGGIFAALSESTGSLVEEGMKAAKRKGAVTSFDMNFREKLWHVRGGGRTAVEVIGSIVENVDVLMGNEEDLQKSLGISGPDVETGSPLDTEVFFSMIEKVLDKYSGIKAIVTTKREVCSANRHLWGAMGWIDGERFVSPICELEVYDRVGGGDGFAAGLIFGLLSGESFKDSLRIGWAHGALLATFPGDTTMATLDGVLAFAENPSARIQR